jgi:hypothetical protein
VQAAARRYREAHKNNLAAKRRAYYATHKSNIAGKRRVAYQAKKYGMPVNSSLFTA